MDSFDERQWNDATLYRCMAAGESKEVFSVVEVGDFLPGPRQVLAGILQRMESPDPARAAISEAIRLGEGEVVKLIPELIASGASWLASGRYYAAQVAELSTKRKMLAAVARFEQTAHKSTGDALWASVEDLTTELATLNRVDANPDDDAFDLEYFESLTAEERPFTVPGMLAKQDRFLMVGKEGGGKSTLVYQLMTGAAYGVDTMSSTLNRYEPQRVLFLDVENSEYQIADQIARVHAVIKDAAPGVKPVWKSLKRKVVDLTETAQAAAVIRSVVAHAPDLVYMGSAYKLAFSDDYRIMARAIMTTVDRIRAEIGASFLIEHHAGWGDKNDRNGWRPDGSSEWSRWADFSRGMDVRMQGNQRVMKLVMSSRMDRSAGRRWPAGFEQGSLLPWRPLDDHEFEYLHGDLYDDEQGGSHGRRR